MDDVCCFKQVKSEGNQFGTFRLYYDKYIPTIAFGRSGDPQHLVHIVPVPVINTLRIAIDGNECKISFTVSNLHPLTFLFNSDDDVATLVQCLISQRIMSIDPNLDNTLVPVTRSGSAPVRDRTIPTDIPGSVVAPFSDTGHADILKELISHGKTTPLFQSLQISVSGLTFRSLIASEHYLDEYLVLREQWELRIPHQNGGKSKHNAAVETLSKDLLRTDATDPTIVLLYNVLRTMITFAPDFGFAQGLVDVTLMIAEIVLDGEIERRDDEAQSLVFWSLNTLLFELGQCRWYQANELWVRDMVRLLSGALASIYPALELFASYEDFQVFQHMIAGPVTLFTRTFAHPVLKKLWNLIFAMETADGLHIAVMAVILILGYPELSKRKPIDFIQVTKYFSSEYPIGEEEEFLALVAAVAEKVNAKTVRIELPEFRSSFFVPRLF
jgi:hypothetical protein